MEKKRSLDKSQKKRSDINDNLYSYQSEGNKPMQQTSRKQQPLQGSKLLDQNDQISKKSNQIFRDKEQNSGFLQSQSELRQSKNDYEYYYEDYDEDDSDYDREQQPELSEYDEPQNIEEKKERLYSWQAGDITVLIKPANLYMENHVFGKKQLPENGTISYDHQMGTQVKILKKLEDRYLVQVGDDEGYMKRTALEGGKKLENLMKKKGDKINSLHRYEHVSNLFKVKLDQMSKKIKDINSKRNPENNLSTPGVSQMLSLVGGPLVSASYSLGKTFYEGIEWLSNRNSALSHFRGKGDKLIKGVVKAALSPNEDPETLLRRVRLRTSAFINGIDEGMVKMVKEGPNYHELNEYRKKIKAEIINRYNLCFQENGWKEADSLNLSISDSSVEDWIEQQIEEENAQEPQNYRINDSGDYKNMTVGEREERIYGDHHLGGNLKIMNIQTFQEKNDQD